MWKCTCSSSPCLCLLEIFSDICLPLCQNVDCKRLASSTSIYLFTHVFKRCAFLTGRSVIMCYMKRDTESVFEVQAVNFKFSQVNWFNLPRSFGDTSFKGGGTSVNLALDQQNPTEHQFPMTSFKEMTVPAAALAKWLDKFIHLQQWLLFPSLLSLYFIWTKSCPLLFTLLFCNIAGKVSHLYHGLACFVCFLLLGPTVTGVYMLFCFYQCIFFACRSDLLYASVSTDLVTTVSAINRYLG